MKTLQQLELESQLMGVKKARMDLEIEKMRRLADVERLSLNIEIQLQKELELENKLKNHGG